MPQPHTPTILAITAATLLGSAVITHHVRAVHRDVRRVETLGERVVITEQAILDALRGGGAEAEESAARLLN